MFDVIAKVAWFAAPPTAVMVVLVAIWKPSNLPLHQRVLVGLCYAAAASLAFISLAAAIVLRDGLGPDSIRSEGATALLRTLAGLDLLLYSVPFAGVGWLLSRRPWSPLGFRHLV